nr:hypothetical protein [Bacteroidota bacterium]
MKELFIHTGVHKTGTTALQSFLYNNRDVLLKKHNIRYPKLDKDQFYFQHNYLATLLKQSKHDEFATLIKSFVPMSGRILLSSESFSGHQKIPKGMGLVKNLFDRVKVIVYLRRQDLWIETIYKQLIKMDHIRVTDPFEIWLDQFLKKPKGIYLCDWMKILEPWVEVFGEENIIVRAYEKIQFSGGTVVKDFLNVLEIPWQDEDLLINNQIHNKSYSKDASEFLRLVNNSPDINYWRNFLPFLFPDPYAETGEVYLSYEKRLGIQARFSESNRKVADVFLKNPNGEPFIEQLPDKNNYPPVYKGLDPEKVIPEIESFIHILEGVKKSLAHQKPVENNLLTRIKRIFLR